jgi:hypothetical protein
MRSAGFALDVVKLEHDETDDECSAGTRVRLSWLLVAA